MSKKSGLKPGNIAPRSGQYQQIGPRGRRGPPPPHDFFGQ